MSFSLVDDVLFAALLALPERHYESSAALAEAGLRAVVNLAGLEPNGARFGHSSECKLLSSFFCFFWMRTLIRPVMCYCVTFYLTYVALSIAV